MTANTLYEPEVDIVTIRHNVAVRAGEIKRREKKEKIDDIIYVVNYTLISFLIASSVVLAGSFFFCNVDIEGSSMYPAYSSGDRVFVSKIGKINRFDVIVFDTSYNEKFIKRVVGLPGETVWISGDGKTYINGKALDDPYAAAPMADQGTYSIPYMLKEDEYFCLGDNRNASTDSRFSEIGAVKKDDVTGKVIFTYTLDPKEFISSLALH